MTVVQRGTALRLNSYGLKVEKTSATLPQSTTQDLFTVVGGRIIITSIIGEVTTAIQAQANNMKLVSAPTTGTAVDLCAVTDVSGKEAGTLLGITGTLSAALVASNAGATVQNNELIVPIGKIRLSCSASNTGATKWTLLYVPLDDAATVTAG